MKKHKKKKERSQGKLLSGVCIFCIAIVLCIYVGGMIFFHTRFFPGTQVNGISCGGKNVSALQDAITEEAGTYKLEITGRDGLSDSITAGEIVLKPVFDDELYRMLSTQKSMMWPFQLGKKHLFETSTVVAYDENAFAKKVEALTFCKKSNQRKPVDAYMSDITDHGYEIIPEDEGSTLIKDMVYSVISDAVLTLEDTLDLDQVGCYVEAKIKRDNAELVQKCNELNRFVQTRVEYQFGDESVVTTPEIVNEWLVRDEKGMLTLAEDKVREFVNDMARKHDSFGKRRSFVTHEGETIDITEGTYGWWMNRPEETKELIERINQGESGIKEPVYFATAAQYGANDWGNTYVEIDLSAQHLYVYVDGEVRFESDFVSGNVARRFNTPRGIYGITYKERNATLVGQGYNSPVSFWMPFNNNVGMHDASWRKTFGGEIYLTNGSHGCINLPKDSAETIFSLVEKNTPVIVYGGKEPVKKEETPEAIVPEPDPEEAVNGVPENIEVPMPEIPIPEITVPETTEVPVVPETDI